MVSVVAFHFKYCCQHFGNIPNLFREKFDTFHPNTSSPTSYTHTSLNFGLLLFSLTTSFSLTASFSVTTSFSLTISLHHLIFCSLALASFSPCTSLYPSIIEIMYIVTSHDAFHLSLQYCHYVERPPHCSREDQHRAAYAVGNRTPAQTSIGCLHTTIKINSTEPHQPPTSEIRLRVVTTSQQPPVTKASEQNDLHIHQAPLEGRGGASKQQSSNSPTPTDTKPNTIFFNTITPPARLFHSFDSTITEQPFHRSNSFATDSGVIDTHPPKVPNATKTNLAEASSILASLLTNPALSIVFQILSELWNTVCLLAKRLIHFLLLLVLASCTIIISYQEVFERKWPKTEHQGQFQEPAQSQPYDKDQGKSDLQRKAAFETEQERAKGLLAEINYLQRPSSLTDRKHNHTLGSRGGSITACGTPSEISSKS